MCSQFLALKTAKWGEPFLPNHRQGSISWFNKTLPCGWEIFTRQKRDEQNRLQKSNAWDPNWMINFCNWSTVTEGLYWAIPSGKCRPSSSRERTERIYVMFTIPAIKSVFLVANFFEKRQPKSRNVISQWKNKAQKIRIAFHFLLARANKFARRSVCVHGHIPPETSPGNGFRFANIFMV